MNRNKLIGFTVVGLLVAVAIGAIFYRNNYPVQKKLRVGCIPIADCGQLFVAIEKGFFKEEGLEIELESLAGGAKILEALGSESLDIGFSNLASVVMANDAGLSFVALTGGPSEGESHKEHAILVRSDGNIKKVEDLAGKTIALNTRKNIDELLVNLLLRKYNVDPSSIRFVEIPFPRMLASLEGRDVDAIASIEPFVTFGKRDQRNKVLTYNYLEIQPTIEISTYAANRDWVAANLDTVKSFQNAIRKATAFANSDESQTKEVLTKYTSLDAEQLKDVVLPNYTEQLSEERLNWLISQLRAEGWIKSEISAAEIIGK